MVYLTLQGFLFHVPGPLQRLHVLLIINRPLPLIINGPVDTVYGLPYLTRVLIPSTTSTTTSTRTSHHKWTRRHCFHACFIGLSFIWPFITAWKNFLSEFASILNKFNLLIGAMWGEFLAFKYVFNDLALPNSIDILIYLW